MTHSNLDQIWSVYTTSPDPLSGMDSLYKTCCVLTRQVLQPSDIVLSGGGFVLHPQLAGSLSDVIPAMDHLLLCAAHHHKLVTTPSIGQAELQTLTSTTGLHSCATQNQVVHCWVLVIDRIWAAMCELKALCVGNPFDPSRKTWISKIPVIASSLPLPLRVKLPKDMLQFFDISVEPRRELPPVQSNPPLSSKVISTAVSTQGTSVQATHSLGASQLDGPHGYPARRPSSTEKELVSASAMDFSDRVIESGRWGARTPSLAGSTQGQDEQVEPKLVDALKDGVKALDIVHVTPPPKSPAPAPATADAVELGGLRVEVTQPRAMASTSTVKRGGLMSVRLRRNGVDTGKDTWQAAGACLAPFPDAIGGGRGRDALTGPRSKSRLREHAVKSGAAASSQRPPAPALVKDEPTVELGGLENTPSMPPAAVIVCGKGMIEPVGLDKTRQHMVIPNLGEIRTRDEESRASSEQYPPRCASPPASLSSPPAAPAPVFDKGPVWFMCSNPPRGAAASPPSAPAAAAGRNAPSAPAATDTPPSPHPRASGQATPATGPPGAAASPPCTLPAQLRVPPPPPSSSPSGCVPYAAHTTDGSAVARVAPPPKSPAPAPAMADAVERGGLRIEAAQSRRTASASVIKGGGLTSVLLKRKGADAGRDKRQAVKVRLARSHLAAESSAQQLLQERMFHDIVKRPCSFVTDYKVFTLVSVIIRTFWITHLLWILQEVLVPRIVWEREGIGTAARR
ncbi:hypothetical protein B0H15DRAFT_807688 [Mycena belliarum]|uniref:Uncharacterized protein n=1 Tax=Mycena belliarum TaxID=1033014 RepID=A0AAD6TQS0_9AGAR|nr:hypothetical protein B0H15DRAFT_807688 [Mycena belliae]